MRRCCDNCRLVTYVDARALGASDTEVVQCAALGRLVHVARGVYLVPVWPFQEHAPYAIAVRAAGGAPTPTASLSWHSSTSHHRPTRHLGCVAQESIARSLRWSETPLEEDHGPGHPIRWHYLPGGGRRDSPGNEHPGARTHRQVRDEEARMSALPRGPRRRGRDTSRCGLHRRDGKAPGEVPPPHRRLAVGGEQGVTWDVR